MLGRLFGAPERRSVTRFSVWGEDWPNGEVWAGVPVSELRAWQSASVYAAVRYVCDTLSALPLDTFIRRGGDRVPYRPRPAWVMEPMGPGTSRIDYYQQIAVSMKISHGAVVYKVRAADGSIAALLPLNPLRVDVRRNPRTLRREFDVEGRVLTDDEIMYIPDLLKPGEVKGTSVVEAARQVIGLDLALTQFAAQFFGNGATAGAYISVPGQFNEEQAKQLVDGFESRHKGVSKAHRPGVLAGGAKVEQSGVDPEKAQMIESRQASDEAVARVLKVPPAILGLNSQGAMAAASVEQQSMWFVRYSLMPMIEKIEEAHSRLLPDRAFIKFNADALLRGDSATQASVYSTAIQAGYMSINDVRRLQDLPPVEGGDTPRVPLANVDLGAAGLAATQAKAAIAVSLVQAGYEPAAVLAALDLPSIPHTGLPSNQLQQVEPTPEEATDDDS